MQLGQSQGWFNKEYSERQGEEEKNSEKVVNASRK